MKVITIKQPWASLIAHGIKDIENRTWACPKKYIGQRVLIHASATSWTWHRVINYFTKPIRDVFIKFGYNGAWLRGLPTSVIIGSVEMVGCTFNHPSIWAEKSKGVAIGGHVIDEKEPLIYNWVLANPVLFEKPIPAKGKLSFWDYLGIKEVKIECPECGSIEIAVEDYTTEPFPTFLHSCNKCGYVIMESEWNVINSKLTNNVHKRHF